MVWDVSWQAEAEAEVGDWAGWRDAPSGEVRMSWQARSEVSPGPVLADLYGARRAAYRRWYLADGDAARPSLAACREALAEHLPAMLPWWRRVVDAVAADVVDARLLSGFGTPPVVRGCSQAVVGPVAGASSALVRNYDWHPDLADGVLLATDFVRPVVGVADVLWGLVDGMNADGLAASLAFGGRRETGPGFAMPMVLRHVLETCTTVADAVEVLRRVPVQAAYSITLLDRAASHATVFLGPARQPRVVADRATTNHQDGVRWPEHAARYRSRERLAALADAASDGRAAGDVVAAMLEPPLRSTDYAGGFGTLYTACYEPAAGALSLTWPGRQWRCHVGDVLHEDFVVTLRRAAAPSRTRRDARESEWLHWVPEQFRHWVRAAA
jgi:predicted choloylglycine hydrolase